MDGFQMWQAAMVRSSRDWESASERMADARRQLDLAGDETTALGERVSPAVQTFLDAWHTQAQRLENEAAGFSDKLDAAWRAQAMVDAATAESLRALIPFDQQDLAPMPRGVV